MQSFFKDLRSTLQSSVARWFRNLANALFTQNKTQYFLWFSPDMTNEFDVERIDLQWILFTYQYSEMVALPWYLWKAE